MTFLYIAAVVWTFVWVGALVLAGRRNPHYGFYVQDRPAWDAHRLKMHELRKRAIRSWINSTLRLGAVDPAALNWLVYGGKPPIYENTIEHRFGHGPGFTPARASVALAMAADEKP